MRIPSQPGFPPHLYYPASGTPGHRSDFEGFKSGYVFCPRALGHGSSVYTFHVLFIAQASASVSHILYCDTLLENTNISSVPSSNFCLSLLEHV